MNPPAKENGQRKLAAPIPTATRTSNTKEGTAQSEAGWRKYFKVHPAAQVFHRFTTDEDRRKLEKDIEKHTLQQPIVTTSVPGEETVYVVDGISRLDAMEAIGWQIVNERGEWMGALAVLNQGRSNVIHHYGYTHERITGLVISLNDKRRHLTTSQRQLIAGELANMKHGGDRKSDQSVKSRIDRLSQSEAAKTFKVGVSGVQAAQKVLREAPEIAEEIAAGKMTVNKAVRNLKRSKPRSKKERPFKDRIWDKWQNWLQRFPPSEVREIKKLVHQWTAKERAQT